MATSVIDEKFLPATLTAPPMTDDEFAAFCAQYPNHQIEITAERDLLISPPTHTYTGFRHTKIQFQLELWSQKDGRGEVSDSSSGFVLPNGARRSPDVAWTNWRRVEASSLDPRQGFLHIAPDFVIEFRSSTDRLATLRRKMREWIDNGTQLAWLIDPERQTVEIYRPNQDPEILIEPKSVQGEAPVKGFKLDLRPVWKPR